MKKILKLITAIIIIIVLIYLVLKFVIFKDKYINIVEKNVINTGIDPYLILSIIKVESNFNAKAVSQKQAKGLMQVLDTTYLDITTRNIDLFNEEDNIYVGVKYFKKLIDKYNGNYYLAIIAYNAGMGTTDNWIKDGIIDNNLSTHKVDSIPYNETKNYLEKVISSYEIYKILY
jgi:soluble lytic murein transglycosylase